jgi:hypothetical protein
MRKGMLVVCLAALALGLTSCATSTVGPGASGEHPCALYQSPRQLWPQDATGNSLIRRGPGDSIHYGRPGAEQQLFQCLKHYHCSLENSQQGCTRPQPPGDGSCQPPKEGDWVEIHTAYAAIPRGRPRPGCDPNDQSLACCKQYVQPLIIRAYQAKVTVDGSSQLPDPWDLPAFEWRGSTTSPDVPGECKVEAQWSFSIGCNIEVTPELIESRFDHPEEARGLQSRVSRLTRVPPPPQ